MCYVCCKELKGWCKSFTRTEGLLSILEAILLVVLISFFVFLILHFVACRTHPEGVTEKAPKKPLPAPPAATTGTTDAAIITSTLSPDIECTWEPSQQTTARTHYYLTDTRTSAGDTGAVLNRYTKHQQVTTTDTLEILGESLEPSHEYDDVEFLEHSDGEAAEDRYKNQVVALVKLKPPGDVTFGCILTKITKFWTLTAASCIESIEEVDSLDSFIMMEEFGEAAQSRPRTVADVRLHPRYQGRTRSHDLAALRSDRALRGPSSLLRLPRVLDYFLVGVGERFHILGYGGYSPRYLGARAQRGRLSLEGAIDAYTRANYSALHLDGERVDSGVYICEDQYSATDKALSVALYGSSRVQVYGHAGQDRIGVVVDKRPEGRRLRQVSVFVVSGAACGAETRADVWAPRHLVRGAATRHGACGAAPLCAGARYSRGTPCNYCAGTPLLRAGTLFGVMSDNSACGVACEPQLYVNIATLRDWIDSIID